MKQRKAETHFILAISEVCSGEMWVPVLERKGNTLKLIPSSGQSPKTFVFAFFPPMLPFPRLSRVSLLQFCITQHVHGYLDTWPHDVHASQILITFMSLLSAVSPPDDCAYIAASDRGDILNPQKMSTDPSIRLMMLWITRFQLCEGAKAKCIM